ncbi:MAG: hypothetical protein SOZ00_07440 [Tidjanibacter sp.]|nr:hypothetical protein [Tidjanibacter sp.]
MATLFSALVAVSIVSTAVFFSGCRTSRRILAQIAAADSLASVAPDSALRIIASVDRRSIYGAADRAAYGLTYSRINDFCDIAGDRDTLIAPAVAYYTRHDDPQRAALAYYYLALTHETGHRDSLALNCLVEAEKLAIRAGDNHTVGLACSGMGRIYDSQLYYTRAVEAHTRAAQAFEAAGERRNLMFAYINRADNYQPLLDYDRAMADDSLALSIAIELRDTVWIMSEISSIAKSLYWKTNEPQRPLEILLYNYRTYYGGEVPIGDNAILYQLYEALGEGDKAMDCINTYYGGRNRYPLDTHPGMYILLSRAAANRGDYKKALEYYEEVLNVDDSLRNKILQNSLLAAEHRFRFDLQESENQRALAKKRVQFAELAVVAVVALGICLFWVLHLFRERRTKRRETEELMAAIDLQRNSKIALVAELDERIEREHRLKEQLETRFSELRAVAAKYYTYGNDERRLRREIERITSPTQFDSEMYATIEKVVDAKNSDVIARLRQSEKLKTDELHLLLLVYAGFSNEEISVIMGMSVSNTAVRKTRLRQRLTDFVTISDDYRF